MVDSGESLPGMVGTHPAMLEMYRQVRIAAPTDHPILIEGETGTGKELVAAAIHAIRHQGRRRPYEALNCAAIPEGLAETELFGCEPGAYTGAPLKRRAGLLELSDGGTLFLDELCSMPVSIQVKLLRAIELHRFTRLGGRRQVHSAFRVVAAISEPAHQLMAERRLRDDLYYRLADVYIRLAPLRERRSDIPLLATHFLGKIKDGPARRFAPDALELLQRFSWPGNVRHLRLVVRQVALLTQSPVIGYEHVLPQLAEGRPYRLDAGHLDEMLRRHQGNVARLARVLRVPRSTLRRWLNSAGLSGHGQVGRPRKDGSEDEKNWPWT